MDNSSNSSIIYNSDLFEINALAHMKCSCMRLWDWTAGTQHRGTNLVPGSSLEAQQHFTSTFSNVLIFKPAEINLTKTSLTKKVTYYSIAQGKREKAWKYMCIFISKMRAVLNCSIIFRITTLISSKLKQYMRAWNALIILNS